MGKISNSFLSLLDAIDEAETGKNSMNHVTVDEWSVQKVNVLPEPPDDLNETEKTIHQLYHLLIKKGFFNEESFPIEKAMDAFSCSFQCIQYDSEAYKRFMQDTHWRSPNIHTHHFSPMEINSDGSVLYYLTLDFDTHMQREQYFSREEAVRAFSDYLDISSEAIVRTSMRQKERFTRKHPEEKSYRFYRHNELSLEVDYSGRITGDKRMFQKLEKEIILFMKERNPNFEVHFENKKSHKSHKKSKDDKTDIDR